MNVSALKEGCKLTIAVEGRIDTFSSKQLSECINENLDDGVGELIIDMEGTDYISSSGLRVFLSTKQQMMKQGTMKIINVQDDVMEIFDMVGLAGLFELE